MPEFRVSLVVQAPLLLLAHGAGAPMDSPFLETFTNLLVARGIGVARFEFRYMAARRSGGRKPPPKMPGLMQEYADAIQAIRQREPEALLLIGGKSMGGRIASMIADNHYTTGAIAACVCLGYPLHPQGKPDQLRTEHLVNVRCPLLVVQGERDALGSRAEFEAQSLSETIAYAWIGDGDHDLKPRKASGLTHASNLASAADAIAAFAQALSSSSRRAR